MREGDMMDLPGRAKTQARDQGKTGTPADAVRHPALAGVEAYWSALRDGGGIPYRSQISPRGLEHALEFAFVLEHIAPGIARLRIAGAHLAALMGMEVRGMPLTAMFAGASRAQVTAITDTLFRDCAIVEMTVAAPRGLGRPALKGQLMLLPLRSDAGAVDRALGCLVTEGRIGRQPRLLRVTGATTRQPQAPSQAGEGFAEPAAFYQPRPDVPYLRVVRTDRA